MFFSLKLSAAHLNDPFVDLKIVELSYLSKQKYKFSSRQRQYLMHPLCCRIRSPAVPARQLHYKKKVSDFPVPGRDDTNQTLPGRE